MPDPQLLWIPTSDELPLWTDVISALASGFAALVALVLGAYSLRVALSERRDRLQREAAAQIREQEAREAEKRSQAEQVTCWLESPSNNCQASRIVVDNASSHPIWNVVIFHELLPDGRWSVPVIAAKERHPTAVNSGRVGRPAEVVDVSFRDNRGRRWRRNSTWPGSLFEQDLIGTPTVIMGEPE